MKNKFLILIVVTIFALISIETVYLVNKRPSKSEIQLARYKMDLEYAKPILKKYEGSSEYCLKLADFTSSKSDCSSNQIIFKDKFIYDIKSGNIIQK